MLVPGLETQLSGPSTTTPSPSPVLTPVIHLANGSTKTHWVLPHMPGICLIATQEPYY